MKLGAKIPDSKIWQSHKSILSYFIMDVFLPIVVAFNVINLSRSFVMLP